VKVLIALSDSLLDKFTPEFAILRIVKWDRQIARQPKMKPRLQFSQNYFGDNRKVEISRRCGGQPRKFYQLGPRMNDVFNSMRDGRLVDAKKSRIEAPWKAGRRYGARNEMNA